MINVIVGKLLDIVFIKKLKGNRTKIAGAIGIGLFVAQYYGLIDPEQYKAALMLLGTWAVPVAIDHGK